MNKLLLTILIGLSIIFASCANTNTNLIQDDLNLEEEEEIIVLDTSDENFLKILGTNQDGKDYMQKNQDTFVLNSFVVKPQDFEELKNSTQYKELYTDLPQKDLHYVEFSSKNSSLNLMTIIDLETQTVVKIYGLFVMGMG